MAPVVSCLASIKGPGNFLITLIFIMTVLFFGVKKRVFVHFRMETLRKKLEPVHFRSGIETQVFFSGKKKVNHFENEGKTG